MIVVRAITMERDFEERSKEIIQGAIEKSTILLSQFGKKLRIG